MKRLIFTTPALAIALILAVAARADANVISGTVTPIAVAQEVEVCVVESEVCTAPGADGKYELNGLPAVPVLVEFIPPYRSHYLVQYWDGVSKLSKATTTVPASTPTFNVNATLFLGAVIEGAVTAAGSSALRGVEVCAFAAGLGTPAGCSQTDAGGEYELPTLLEGSYAVGFFGRGPSAEYVSEDYPEVVNLTTGQVRAGVDAELAKGAQLRGTVSAAVGGGPLASVPVCLFAGAAVAAEQCVFSDSAGGYAFVGLPAGSYQVGFSLNGEEIGSESGGQLEDDYLSQYYDGVSSRPAAATIALSGAQVQSGVDAALLTPPVPSPLAPVTLPANPVVAAAPLVAEPKPVAKGCKRGYVRKKHEGKTLCIKAKKKHKGTRP